MKPHVLILEDNFIISYDMAGLVTENLHAKPILARSVECALKLIPDDIAFAFLDIDVLDGVSYPVAQKLVDNHIPFIFLSAKNRSTLPEKFSKTPFLSKPFDGNNLMQLTKSLTSAFE
jgi:two-component SAPR family response regulator